MKNIYLLTASALLLCFTGCSSTSDNYIPQESDPDEDIEVLLEVSGTINNHITRASDLLWSSSDAIGVTVGTDINIQYKNTGGNDFSVVNKSNDICLRTSTAKTITAYYPYTGTDKTSPGIIPITADATAQRNQPAIDFMFAKGAVYASNPVTDLRFTHKMSKAVFRFEPATGAEMSDLSYSLYNVYVTGTFNTETGSITRTAIGDIKDVEVKLPISGSMTSSLILIPQTLKGIKVELCINNLYYEANYDFIFSGGFAESYVITIPKDPGEQLIISTEIQSGQWTSGGNSQIVSE